MASDIDWQPHGYYEEGSNIAAFMDTYGYTRYEDLRPSTESELRDLWGDMADDVGIVWIEEYDAVVDTSAGVEFAEWYPGGELNAVETILDRWVTRAPDSVMYAWEDERGNKGRMTYAAMAERSNRLANAFREHGIEQGDVVGLVFPMHPNGFAAALACLRIGAVFTMIFPGYGAGAISQRLADANAKLVVTADGYHRNGKTVDLLSKVDTALSDVLTVEDAVVYDHIGIEGEVANATSHSWDSFLANHDTDAESAILESDSTAFIAYSSGTTGRPKGTIHTHASLLVMGNKECKYHFDLSEGDTLLWITDFGWIIVPIWMLAGSPALGATTVLFEGGPTHPTDDRVWEAIERYDVNTFGIAPSGAHRLRQLDVSPRDDHYFGSLSVLGSTGEPWGEDDWRWFLNAVGGGETPIVNASGGTELAGAILSPTLCTPLKPGTLLGPAPGVAANIYTESGDPADEGYLVIELPIPGMTHGLTAGDDRYLAEYWEDFEGVWNQNDWARRDEDGFWYVTGRADDTMNIAGRRITAPEIEEAIASYQAVNEATVISLSDASKGEVPIAFVTLSESTEVKTQQVESGIRSHVGETLGDPFRPDRVYTVPAVPRTQTGKIPRSVIAAVYRGEQVEESTTLDDAAVLEAFPRRKEE